MSMYVHTPCCVYTIFNVLFTHLTPKLQSWFGQLLPIHLHHCQCCYLYWTSPSILCPRDQAQDTVHSRMPRSGTVNCIVLPCTAFMQESHQYQTQHIAIRTYKVNYCHNYPFSNYSVIRNTSQDWCHSFWLMPLPLTVPGVFWHNWYTMLSHHPD